MVSAEFFEECTFQHDKTTKFRHLMPVREKKIGKKRFSDHRQFTKIPGLVSLIQKNRESCSPEIQKAPFQVPETRWGVA